MGKKENFVIISGIIVSVIGIYLLPMFKPSVNTLYENSNVAIERFYVGKKSHYCTVDNEKQLNVMFANAEYGIAAFDIVNNNESTLKINDIWIKVKSFNTCKEFSDCAYDGGSGGYAAVMTYQTEIRKECGLYKANLVKNNSDKQLSSRSEIDEMYCQVAGLGRDTFFVFVQPQDSGIFELQVKINYSINNNDYEKESNSFTVFTISQKEFLEKMEEESK